MHSATSHINWLKSAGNHGSKRKTPKAASLKRVRRLWRATNVGPKNKQCASDVVVPREPARANGGVKTPYRYNRAVVVKITCADPWHVPFSVLPSITRLLSLIRLLNSFIWARMFSLVRAVTLTTTLGDERCFPARLLLQVL